jgi:hypothetical protein
MIFLFVCMFVNESNHLSIDSRDDYFRFGSVFIQKK